MNIIERFKNEKLSINCKSEEEAKELIKIFYDNDLIWKGWSGNVNTTHFNEKEQYPDPKDWNKINKVTCYSCNDFKIDNSIGSGSIYAYEEFKYEIMTFEEFKAMVNTI